MAKFTLLALALVCGIQIISADDGQKNLGSNYFILGGGSRVRDGSDSGERRVVIQPRTERVVYSQPIAVRTPSYRQRDYSDEYDQNAKYQFAYRARAAGGYGKAGYGDDSGETRYASGASAEFGHSESRDGGKTTGAYFVELPDGRLQRVDYYVDGNSGYVARVSYSGKGASGERDGYVAN